jgi:hypothetical protein
MVDKHGQHYFLEVNPRVQVRERGRARGRCVPVSIADGSALVLVTTLPATPPSPSS